MQDGIIIDAFTGGEVEHWRETEEAAAEQWNRRVSDKEGENDLL